MENNIDSFHGLIDEANKKQKTADEINKMMSDYFSINSENLVNIKDNTNIYETGGELGADEIGVNKVVLKMVKRFCKTHASYVLKDMPNIKIKAKNEEVPESNILSSSVQKGLLIWWKEQSILRKLKRSVRKASYKGMQAFYLSNNPEQKTFNFGTIDPEFMAYDTMTDDPDSPLLWFAHGDMIDLGILKKAFPEHSDKFMAFSASKFFQNASKLNIVFKDLNYLNKAFYFEFLDTKYRYKFVNDIMVGVSEHNYPFIPFYVFPYFDLDSKKISSVVDFIKEPAKMINQVFGYRLDFTIKHSDPPLTVTGAAAGTELDPKKLKGGILKLQQGSTADYISPKANSIDAERMIELVKSFMHFLTGLSEEAMAGFTGSLTAAGVSIELRLDSTVREALDTQVILQDILQKINRDYLKLMELTYPEKNMHSSEILGVLSDKEFSAKMIAGLYDNIVDFGGILPRSQDQIVRNTVTQFTTGLISQETALSQMNHPDPTLEMAKIRAGKINEGKLNKEIEMGLTSKEKFFATAELENAYMFETKEMATPAPDQDHELHIAIHEQAMEKLSPELKSMFALHIQIHKQMAEKIKWQLQK